MKPVPVLADSIPVPEKKTVYPQPFAALLEGRVKRKLGDYFGLSNFGVNLTELSPGAISALLHHHSRQDEFIYILQGEPTLVLGQDEYILRPGDCYGFRAGTRVASQLVNRSSAVVRYIEIGDRSTGDEVEYPNDDLRAVQLPDGQWRLTHKDGRPYE
ncbi:MAG TPA: cupin domain-containing protein [Gammaproteobacteria bacterium]|nr:cupin domain-containing protein [Gammaproteobacteria bacterium]